MLRGLGLPDDAEHVNPYGGAIARHPLGMSGARLALTAAISMQERSSATPWPRCASGRPGSALLLERA